MIKKILFGAVILSVTAVQGQESSKDSISTRHLKEVTVLGNTNKFKVDKSQSVAKIPLKDLENPQVYNTITADVLKEQVALDLNSALKNATGITRLWESTGRGNDGSEYYSMRGFNLQPTIVNGVASLTNGTLDPANVESIEVIKGPSGTLYGGNLIYYGGLINVTTKKPFDTFGGEMGYVTGSYGLNRLTTDINTPLNNQSSVRLNAAYSYQNTFQNAGFNRSLFIAPSFKFKASEALTFLFNTEYKTGEKVNAPMIFFNRSNPISFSNLNLFLENYKNSFTSNQLTIKNPTFSLQAQALYVFNNHWSSQTILSSSNTTSDGYYQYLWDAVNGSDFYRYISKYNSKTSTIDIQQNFTGDHTFGNMRNRLVVGADYLQKELTDNNSPWVADGIVSLSKQTDSGNLTTEGVNSLLAASTASPSDYTVKIWSGYFSDVFNFTSRLSALVGMRLDNYSAISSTNTQKVNNQVTFSQKIGLVYQPVLNKLSLFSNYMNGFQNLEPVAVYDLDKTQTGMHILKPEKANQWEIGAKTEIFDKRLSVTASYYDIRVKDKSMTASDGLNTIQGGTVKSRGVELSIIANPIEGLNVIAGYSYNDSKVTKDGESSDYLGLRPEEAGPANLANLWVSYKVGNGALKGFTFGAGGNTASSYKTLNRHATGNFTLPGYTLFNALISYSGTGNKYSISLKGDNLTNKKYFGGWSTITPQSLRTIALALNYKF
ncbi:MAG: TonB-dependent receptor [Dysgonamonadaceae bacterium]